VRHHLSTNPEDKDEIIGKMNKGEALPDTLLNNLVASRLKQADCRINGWILDDYGYTPDQIANFKALRIKPSVVLAMDQSEEISISRIKHRRIDPKTGEFYNLRLDAPKDEAVHKRLIYQSMDDPNCVANRFTFWKGCVNNISESFGTQYKAIPAERDVDAVFESIADVV
jgi:adenylate kinase